MHGTASNTSPPLVCGICWNALASRENCVSCDECKVAVELQCVRALLCVRKFPALWRCPKCAAQDNSPGQCEVCCFDSGLLLPLSSKSASPASGCWVHPFCCYFHSEFYKRRDQDFFSEDKSPKSGREKIAGKRKEKQDKAFGKALSCVYCKRDCGRTKECSKCHKASIHVICAYKENKLFLESNAMGVKEFVCSMCAAKRNNIEESKDKAVRKSTRINSKVKRADLMQVGEQEESNDKKQGKRHNTVLLMNKVKCNYHPKSVNILKGLIDFIMQADQLKVFMKDYANHPIELTPEDVKVISITVLGL